MIPRIFRSEGAGAPRSIGDLCAAVERDRPDLVDDEVELATGAVRWKHEFRWELETLVVKGEVKDLGRGVHSP